MLRLLCRNSVRTLVRGTTVEFKTPQLTASIRYYVGACPIQKNNCSLHSQKTISLLISKRSYGERPIFKSSKKLERLQASDGVPPRYELIYRTDMGNYFLGAQVMILSGLCGMSTFLLYQLYLRFSGGENEGEAPKLALPMFDPVIPEGEKPPPLQPKVDDVFEQFDEDDIWSAMVIAALTFSMAVLMYRLLRQFPVRIYIANSGHCFGVYYSPFIPGGRVLREFVAGTVKPAGKSNFLFRNQLYRDGSGGLMFLLEDAFRTPADFNDLLDSEWDGGEQDGPVKS